MALDRAFWSGKRVLLTGHTGFKGSWTALWLQSLGAKVIGYALPPTEPSLFSQAAVGPGMVSAIGDVEDLSHLEKVYSQYSPEIVIHMAAQALVRRSFEDPVRTYATNVMGTVNVLEAARQAGGVRVALVVTSDKCYEDREWVWPYRETDRLGGGDPYSSSKSCAELVTATYRRAYFTRDRAQSVSVASVRAGNVIGGGDWAADRLVPDCVRAVLGGRPPYIRNPTAIRPWQFVLGPVEGYLLLVERLWREGQRYAEAWNFSTPDTAGRSVSWLVERFLETWGASFGWESDPGDHPHEVEQLRLDSSKARTLLGWTNRLSLEEAVAWLVRWYRTHARGENLADFTRTQIRDYETLTRTSADGHDATNV